MFANPAEIKITHNQTKCNFLAFYTPRNISEKRKVFSPHLTIGRVKSARNQRVLLEAMKEKEEEVIGSLEIDRICLYQSILTPDGPLYEVQEEFPFRTKKLS